MDQGDVSVFEEAAETMPEEEHAALQGDRLSSMIEGLLVLGGLQAERLRAADAGPPGGARPARA